MNRIPHEGPLDRAVKAIRSGGVVAYPTETFYGLAVDATCETALKRLFDLKGRERSEPISVIAADMAMVESMAATVPEAAKRLAERFWPGPLTIIFKAKSDVLDMLTAGTGKIGVRVSSGKTAARFAAEAGVPITATSANPSGKIPASDPMDVDNYFEDAVEVIIDADHLDPSLPSTVVDVTVEPPQILRTGAVEEELIAEVLG